MRNIQDGMDILGWHVEKAGEESLYSQEFFAHGEGDGVRLSWHFK
jgi:hypothetical protein